MPQILGDVKFTNKGQATISCRSGSVEVCHGWSFGYMKLNQLILIIVLMFCGSVSAAENQQLNCSEDGMAGITFGQTIAENNHKIVEKAFSGVTYFEYQDAEGLAPFEKLIVSMTPKRITSEIRKFIVDSHIYNLPVNIGTISDRFRNVVRKILRSGCVIFITNSFGQYTVTLNMAS